jgi:hypothetical protein
MEAYGMDEAANIPNEADEADEAANAADEADESDKADEAERSLQIRQFPDPALSPEGITSPTKLYLLL